MCKLGIILTSLLATTLSLLSQAHASSAPYPMSTYAAGNGNGANQDQTSAPAGLGFDQFGTLFIADTDNHRVLRVVFDEAGVPTYDTVAGGNSNGFAANQLYHPAGVALMSDGSLLIADTYNHRVQRVTFSAGGDPQAATTLVGGNGAGSGPNQFNLVTGIALGPDGTLFVADRENHRVQSFALDGAGNSGSAVTVAGLGGLGVGTANLNEPRGLAVDPDGSLFIADYRNQRVQKITFDNVGDPSPAVTVAGGNGDGNGVDQLSYPRGVAVRFDGSLYVSDSDNDRIQEITFDDDGNPAEAVTVAGGAGNGWFDTQFNLPKGIGFDHSGVLHVVDSGNHRIQRVALPVLDSTDPTIDLVTPSSGRVGGHTTIVFDCADEGGASLASCVATLNGQLVESGDVVNHSTRRLNTLMVTASDLAGNVASSSVNFQTYGRRELTGEYEHADGDAGVIARLYMAAFLREPEAAGFNYWMVERGDGAPTIQIADRFALGAEFRLHLDTGSDADFVDLMYRRVFGRQSDLEGRVYWVDRLGRGLTRSELLLQFSESPEFLSLTRSGGGW